MFVGFAYDQIGKCIHTAIAAENEGRTSKFMGINFRQGAFKHKFPILFVRLIEQTNEFATGLG